MITRISNKYSMKCFHFRCLVSLCYTILSCNGQCKILPPTNQTRSDYTIVEKGLLEIISPLNGKTFKFRDTASSEQYTYTVKICGGAADFVGALQEDINKTYHVLGRYNQTDIMGGTNWILLTYYGGDIYHHYPCNNTGGRMTKIMIICDPDNLEGKLEILEERKSSETSCYYLFELNSSVACKKPSSKLSSGSVFCILVFTAICVYLVCGFLYQRIVVGAKGLEQIPNYSFWRAFGNLQADGCDYICRCGPRQESQAYRGIDEHLKEEERDDQLLNM